MSLIDAAIWLADAEICSETFASSRADPETSSAVIDVTLTTRDSDDAALDELQKALEERGITPLSATHEYLCNAPTTLGEAEATEVMTLLDKLEQDDDVQNVYHTLA